MVKINIKAYITVLVVTTIFVFILVAYITGHDPNNYSIKEFFTDISKTITIVFALTIGFVSYAWRWCIFKHWLVTIPYLGGTWEGVLNSTYEGARPNIQTTVNIRQTFFHIQVKMKTGESKSHSYCGAFDIDLERGCNYLVYSYLNEPSSEHLLHNVIHRGTCRLEINEDATKLEGDYWTNNKTTGTMSLRKI